MPARRRTLLLALGLLSLHAGGFLFAQARPADEQIWQDFLKWFDARPESTTFRVLMRDYRQKLAADGLAPSVIDQRIAVIEKAVRERRGEWARIFYNKSYASATYTFNTDPNAFLVRMVESLKPGKALDSGMGQGRNAVFLAHKGWEVTGYDISEQGIAVARKNAERAGVKINAVVADHDGFDWGTERWDLVCMIYAGPRSPAKLYSALKPGGVVIMESFLYDAAERQGAKPPDLAGPNELLGHFKDFRILHYEDVEGVSDFPPRRKTRLVRLMAQKPQTR